MAAFLAQVEHESGQLQYVRELGNDKYLEKTAPGSTACSIDKVSADDAVFEQITRKINGGTHGLADRQALYRRALEVLQ